MERINEYMARLCRHDYCDPTEIMRTYCDLAAYVMANPDHLAGSPDWRRALHQNAMQLVNLDTHMRRLIHDGYDVKAMEISRIFLFYLEHVLPRNEKYIINH